MNLKWYLLAVLFLLTLTYEYVKHVLIEGHEIYTIVPSLLYYAVIIVPLVLWAFSKLEKQGMELADREKKLRNFFESTRDAVFEVDSEGRFTFMNQAGAEMCALSSPEEVIGRHATEFWAEPGERDAYLAELKEKGYVEQYPLRARRANGEPAYWELTSNLLKDEEGNFAGIRGICRDVTQRKKLEQQLKEYAEQLEEKVEERTRELRESEERIRGLVETSTDAIISANERGRIILWNKAAERIFGYAKAEALGKALTLIIPEEYREPHRRALKRYLETGEAKVIGKTVELQGLRRDGSVFPVELSLAARRERGGYVFTSVIRDVTEKRRAEQQLRRYAEELERSNKLKDLFTDIMRHDLQNPVAVIKGLSGILVEDDLPGDVGQGLMRIRRNAEKLEEMIDAASKYAKLESAEELDFQELDLNEVLRGVIRVFRPLLDEKGMRLKYRDGVRMPVVANPVIEDVFMNLLSNAIKYGPVGGEIVIEAEDKGADWRVAVKDQGEGVPDSSKEAVFDRFKRLDKGGVKGAGLGLAIVKRVIELHKGRAWVEDNKPKGSIFYVTIPKKRQ